jgi:hypothetical protein
MTTRAALLLPLLALLGAHSLEAGPELVGRWVSVEIDRKEQESIGAGWTIVFRPDGTFTEEIDEGFGIVEVWSGTYQLNGANLSMHRSGFKEAWEFSAVQKRSDLSIARRWGGKEQYVVLFKQSEVENPALANLPRWPKSKTEAVEILKQKMDKGSLDELAGTPKDDLIGKYHFGLGMYIRNAFGVWRGNKELWEDLTHGEPTHPDNLSGYIIEALWDDLDRKLSTEERAKIEVKRAVVVRKRLAYERLESQCEAQLKRAQAAFEDCYAKHGLPSENPKNRDPFFRIVVAKTGRVHEIEFFDGASPELKDCLRGTIEEFRFDAFADDEFVTLYITQFPYCRVSERNRL